jgi:hypothetical protein
MVVFGIEPDRCRVEIDEGQLHVHLGWAFRLHASLADVRTVEPDSDPVRGWGAHGWRGTWLVNGSSAGVVRITFDPPAHGHTAGIPVTVRVLRVSVDDPDALVEALLRSGEGYASA